MKRFGWGTMLAVIAVGAATLIVACLVGSESVDPRLALSSETLDAKILWHVRLPRVLLAAVSGAGLAVVGTALQAWLRNPLADPYVLGVSGGSALGATAMLALGLGSAWATPLGAFGGGLAAMVLTAAIARTQRSGSGLTLLLAGIVVNAICSSAITLIKVLVSPTTAQELLAWLTGFVSVPPTGTLAALTTYVLLGSTMLWFAAGELNVLSLGETSAQTLGVDLPRLERKVLLASSLVVGAVVSFTGLIGFVGLIVPHALRRLFGPDARRLLPVAAVTGAALLVVCDLFARLAFRWWAREPPVGAVTALLGGPAFFAILLGSRRQVEPI